MWLEGATCLESSYLKADNGSGGGRSGVYVWYNKNMYNMWAGRYGGVLVHNRSDCVIGLCCYIMQYYQYN